MILTNSKYISVTAIIQWLNLNATFPWKIGHNYCHRRATFPIFRYETQIILLMIYLLHPYIVYSPSMFLIWLVVSTPLLGLYIIPNRWKVIKAMFQTTNHSFIDIIRYPLDTYPHMLIHILLIISYPHMLIHILLIIHISILSI